MKFPRQTLAAFTALVAIFIFPLLGSLHAQSVNIALSQVGDSGNAPDPSTGLGGVAYAFSIGTFDVTLSQYSAFLNAVASSDPYGLYNSQLESNPNIEGITQAGVSGSFTYSVIGNSGSDPVTYVSWLDAARFCNWLQNGQPASGVESPATTEAGAYTLDGDTTSGLETRNPGATWWIPSENEWYKAAYYDPALQNGSGGYWLYPTQSNSVPGNIIGNTPNQANYNDGFYSVTQDSTHSTSQDYLTPVGAFTASASYFGTYDQGGDVSQWNDFTVSGAYRGFLGGDWNSSANELTSSFTDFDPATDESFSIGFRIASIPEPHPAVLILAAFLALVARRGTSYRRYYSRQAILSLILILLAGVPSASSAAQQATNPLQPMWDPGGNGFVGAASPSTQSVRRQSSAGSLLVNPAAGGNSNNTNALASTPSLLRTSTIPGMLNNWDSETLSGGDDWATLQTFINSMPSGQVLLFDSDFAISKSLRPPSGSVWLGDGVHGPHLIAHSDMPVLSTVLTGATLSSSNIVIQNIVFDCNGGNQDFNESDDPWNLQGASWTNWWVFGVWLGSATNVTFRGNTIFDPRSYALTISNLSNFTIADNQTAYRPADQNGPPYVPPQTPSLHHDGIHM